MKTSTTFPLSFAGADLNKPSLAVAIGLTCIPALSAAVHAQEAEFKGKIGKTLADSEQHWPKPVAPGEGAPNVLVYLIDDMGYGHASPFGGLTPAPSVTRLRENSRDQFK